MSKPKPRCPICEMGSLSIAMHDLEVKHGDSVLTVRGLEHSVCDRCDAEPVLTEQIRKNQRRIADAKRHAGGLLAGDDIRALRERLGLTQQDAAAIFGGGANAFSKYERGDVIQSYAMDCLLKVTGLYPFVLPMLRAMAGLGGEVLFEDYTKGETVCVNDPSYRSHAVEGRAVVVHLAQWPTEKVA